MSTQNYKELLASTHPLFRVPATKVFWFDSVMNKESHQGIRQRFMAITSPGIFIFERRTFPKGYIINRIISYSDLILICADSDSMQFFKAKVTLNLQSSRHLEAVAIVLAIRNALFGDKPRAPKIIIDPSVCEQIEKYQFAFESGNLVADRFLSLCLNIDEKNLNPEEISDIYDCLKVSQNFVQISSEILNSPLISAVSLAIAYDNEIQTLHLKNINFSLLVSHFIPIVQYNFSIQKLYLSTVTFSGKIQSYVEVWNDKTAFSANQFIFNDCNLTSTDFVTFFKTFKKFPADMQSIMFNNCNISTLALETIFSTISSSLCFRTLTELSFSHMKTDAALQTCFLQFITSNFFMVQKNLQCLSLEDIGIDIHLILPFLLNNPSYISNLSLIGNNFLNPISIKDFHNVIDMDLSFMHFTSDSLLSILNCMASSENHPHRITLDSLVISDDDWEIFYHHIGSIVISKLVMISFCGNKMKAEWMHLFKTFLLNHPSLSELGISYSILYDDAEDSINDLIQVVESKTIKKLEIKGKGDTILKQKLIPLIKAILTRATIKLLDITGQEISNIGLELIAQSIKNNKDQANSISNPQNQTTQTANPENQSKPLGNTETQHNSTNNSDNQSNSYNKSENQANLINQENNTKTSSLMIEELRFDGNMPSSFDEFTKIIAQIEQSSMISSEWPECDARHVFSLTEPNMRPTISKQMEKIKKQFVRRFALEDEITIIPRNLEPNRQRLKKPSKTISQLSPLRNQSSAQQLPMKRSGSRSRKLSFSSSKPFLQSSKRILNKRMKEETNLSRPPQLDLNILSFKEEYVDNALAECLGSDLNEMARWTDEEKQSKEPFVIELQKLNKDTSIQAFLAKKL